MNKQTSYFIIVNGDISMEMVKEMVSNSLAIKESSGSGDTSMR